MESEPVLTTSASVSVSVPAPRSMVVGGRQRRSEGDRVGTRAGEQRFDVRNRRHVGVVAERQAIVAAS